MNILIVNNVVPDADRSGADLRLYSLMKSLVRMGHSLTLVSHRRAPNAISIEIFREMGITVFDGCNQLSVTKANSLISTIVTQTTYGFAIISLWFWDYFSMPEQYMDALRMHAPSMCIAILSDDRHGERQHQISTMNSGFLEIEKCFDIREREIETYRQSDCVLSISESERISVKESSPTTGCFVIPFVLRPQAREENYRERNGVCFLGNFSNAANRVAFEILLNSILPILQLKLGNIPLFVGGTNSEKLSDGGNRQVHLLGHQTDLASFFNARRLFISPTPFGTGITTKVAMAMSYGIPVITTPIGCQSLNARPNIDIICESSIELMASSAIAIYEDEFMWNSIARNAHDLIAANTDEVVEEALARVLDWVTMRTYRESRIVHWSIKEAIKDGRAARPNCQDPALLCIAAGTQALLNSKPNQAIRSFRHAISLSKTRLKEEVGMASSYFQLLRGMKMAYRQMKDDEGLTRVRQEQRLFKRTSSLALSDEV